MADQIYWDDVEEGQEFSLNEPMCSQRLVVWAAASGDFYQIHYDDNFAKISRSSLMTMATHICPSLPRKRG